MKNLLLVITPVGKFSMIIKMTSGGQIRSYVRSRKYSLLQIVACYLKFKRDIKKRKPVSDKSNTGNLGRNHDAHSNRTHKYNKSKTKKQYAWCPACNGEQQVDSMPWDIEDPFSPEIIFCIHCGHELWLEYPKIGRYNIC